jgi:hypothetical protein
MLALVDHVQAMWRLLWQGDDQAIVFWSAVYAGLVGSWSLVHQVRIRLWPSTPGVLVHAGLAQWGGPAWTQSEQQYKLKGLYRYEVEGHTFEGRRVSPWLVVTSHNARFILQRQLRGVKQNPDGTVAVYFNPRRPSKSFLIRPGLAGMLVTVVLILAPALYYWSRFHAP